MKFSGLMIVSNKENLITRRSSPKRIETEKIILNMWILFSRIYATQSRSGPLSVIVIFNGGKDASPLIDVAVGSPYLVPSDDVITPLPDMKSLASRLYEFMTYVACRMLWSIAFRFIWINALSVPTKLHRYHLHWRSSLKRVELPHIPHVDLHKFANHLHFLECFFWRFSQLCGLEFSL